MYMYMYIIYIHTYIYVYIYISALLLIEKILQHRDGKKKFYKANICMSHEEQREVQTRMVVLSHEWPPSDGA